MLEENIHPESAEYQAVDPKALARDLATAAETAILPRVEAQADIVFEACGTFGALHKAETWIAANGYSKGSICQNDPVGLMFGGQWCIAKWKNLTAEEQEGFDALLLPLPEFREGGCKIVFRKAGAK